MGSLVQLCTKTAGTPTILIIVHESDIILNDKLSYYVVLCFCRFVCLEIFVKSKTLFSIPFFCSQFGPILGNANTGRLMFELMPIGGQKYLKTV